MANQPTKYRKFIVGAASAALVASAVAPVASAAGFSDTKGNTHEVAIDALSDLGIISGYPDGSFKPNQTLTRSDVVKMMGKWLVSLGNEIPADYKTNPRFKDLTSDSNNELLQYAALVADRGVFQGNNGKLDPTGNITRENMALVLVRAYDAIHGTDLVETVKGEDFKRDVTDLATAKAEAQPYIDVLDYYDITNPAAPVFNPKGTTTRGQFASFLHRTANLDEVALELRIIDVVGLNDTNQFLQINFSKPVTTGLEPSDIQIRNAKSGASYGVKEVKLAANGMSAQVELFQAKENENVLQYLTDYVISVNANSELLTFTFNRPAFVENRVVSVDVKNNKFTILTDAGRELTLEVRDTFEGFKEMDFYSLLGEEVRVWYDDKNRLVDYKVIEASAQIDAVELKAADEVKLIGANQTYDISDDVFKNDKDREVFALYVDGKRVDKDGKIPTEYVKQKYNYGKVGFDDSGDVSFVSVYNLNEFLIVDKVEKDEVVGYKGEGTGASFNAKDATIVKDGKIIKHADLQQGDVLFFSKDANGDDGFAEVVNKTVSGKIETVFENAVRIDGKTYNFNDNVGIEDYNVDYDNAVFINDDGETEQIDADDAEELQAAGAVTLYTDRAGHVVYIGGDTANVERNTLISILTANIAGETQFNRDRIQVEAVYSTGEDQLFDIGLKDLKSIIKDGVTYDIDNDAKTKWSAKLSTDGKSIVLSDNEGKKSNVTISLADTKGDVVKLHLNKNRDRLEKLEFYSTRSGHLTNANLEKGDSYVDGKKLNSKTIVFDAKKFTNNASDIKTTTWGEYDGGKIKEVTYAYDKDNEVVGLVINDTESDADTLEEALITNVLRNTDGEIVEITAFISGQKRTIKVDEVVASGVERGAFAVLVFDDKNDTLVEGIIPTGQFSSNSKLGSGYAFKGKVGSDDVNVGKREVTVNGQTFKLANDGLVIDARDKNDIKEKSLTDLRGKDVTVILDEKNSNFVKFFVYGGVTTNLPELNQVATPAEKVVAQIDALPKVADITLDNEKAVQDARAAYDALTTAQKEEVSKSALEKLENAEAKIAELKAENPVEFKITTAEKSYTNDITEALGLANITVEGTVASDDNVSEVKITILPLEEDQEVVTATVDANGKFKYTGLGSSKHTTAKVEYVVNGETKSVELALTDKGVK